MARSCAIPCFRACSRACSYRTDGAGQAISPPFHAVLPHKGMVAMLVQHRVHALSRAPIEFFCLTCSCWYRVNLVSRVEKVRVKGFFDAGLVSPTALAFTLFCISLVEECAQEHFVLLGIGEHVMHCTTMLRNEPHSRTVLFIYNALSLYSIRLQYTKIGRKPPMLPCRLVLQLCYRY